MLRLGVKRLTTEPPGAFRTAWRSRGLRSLSIFGGVKACGRCIRLGLCDVVDHPPALSFLHGKAETRGTALDALAIRARIFPCPNRGAGNEGTRLRGATGFT